MAAIRYGSVQLQLVKMNTFAQEAIYTDDGKDYIYTKFTVDAMCLVSSDIYGSNPADVIRSLRAATLAAPRQRLTVWLGPNEGNYLIDSPAPDAAGYPRVLLCDLVGISGYRTVTVRIVFESYQRDCNPSTDGTAYLSHRWSVTHSLDQEWRCTRTIDGTIIARAGAVQSADDLRELCFAAQPRRFRWIGGDFRCSSDGLRLDYTVRDKEELIDFPTNVTTFKGRYTERAEMGSMIFGDIYLDLAAPNSIPKAELFKRGAEIILGRFTLDKAINNANTGGDRLIAFNFMENIHENSIVLQATVIRGGGDAKGDAGQKQIPKIGLPPVNIKFGQGLLGPNGEQGAPYSDPNYLQYPPYGTSGVKAIIQAWSYVVCQPGQKIVPGVGTNDGRDEMPANVTFSLGDFGNEGESDINAEEQAYPYIQAHLETHIGSVMGKAQMPLSSADPSTSDPSTSEIVDLHAPSSYRVINFNYVRLGKKPTLPKVGEASDDKFTFTLGENEVLLDKRINFTAPQLLPNKKDRVYRASGWLLYGNSKHADELRKQLNLGALQNQTDKIDDNVTKPDDWIENIIKQLESQNN